MAKPMLSYAVKRDAVKMCGGTEWTTSRVAHMNSGIDTNCTVSKISSELLQ